MQFAIIQGNELWRLLPAAKLHVNEPSLHSMLAMFGCDVTRLLARDWFQFQWLWTELFPHLWRFWFQFRASEETPAVTVPSRKFRNNFDETKLDAGVHFWGVQSLPYSFRSDVSRETLMRIHKLILRNISRSLSAVKLIDVKLLRQPRKVIISLLTAKNQIACQIWHDEAREMDIDQCPLEHNFVDDTKLIKMSNLDFH